MAGDESCDLSDLSLDLIYEISTKVPDFADRARLRAVCKTWNSYIPLPDPSPRLPWLLDFRTLSTGESIGYYSLFSNKNHMIECSEPQQGNPYLFSSADGFIFCCQPYYNREASLFNPLTGLVISLPPLDEHVDVLGIASNILQEQDLVVLSGSRMINGEGDCNMYVASIRPGDKAWKTITLDIPSHSGVCLYHDGLYYINECGIFKRTLIMDTTGKIISIVPSPDLRNRIITQHILESCGEILIIFRYYAIKLEEISFGIFRLENLRGNYQWVEVRGIGDRLLFLNGGRNGGGGFSLSSSHFSGFKGNCIYYLEDDLDCTTVSPCRYDLENKTIEMLPNYPGDGNSTWFIPKFV